MNNRLKTSVFSFVAAILILSLFAYFFCEEKRYCGTVKYKIMNAIHHKYSAENDPILVVSWNNGSVGNVHASWDTYLSAKVGDNVCFFRKIKEFDPTFMNNGVMLIISFICTFISFWFVIVNIIDHD